MKLHCRIKSFVVHNSLSKSNALPLFIAQITSFHQAVAHHFLVDEHRNCTSKNQLFVLGNAEKSFSAFHFRLISRCRWLPEKKQRDDTCDYCTTVCHSPTARYRSYISLHIWHTISQSINQSITSLHWTRSAWLYKSQQYTAKTPDKLDLNTMYIEKVRFKKEFWWLNKALLPREKKQK